MNHPHLPSKAFIHPIGQNHTEIEALIHQVVTQLLDHLSHAGDRPPLPTPIHPIDLVAIPDHPISESQLLEQLDAILSSSMNAANPKYIGHMDSMPTTVSMLGDLIASALNNNMLSIEMSPLFSQLEPLLLRQFADVFGLGDAAGGVMVSGGTLANLQAIAVARNLTFQAREDGIINLTQQPVILASQVAHTSIQKAAMLLGLGTSAVIQVPTTQNSQLSVDALEEKIAQAKASNQIPFCIVATAGTTTTGNIDPIPDIHRVAKAHGLWLHVDAAYGGAIAFSPNHRNRLAGIEHANSITFNPQKWLYVAKTCAVVLFKTFSDLTSAFQVQAPYMKQTDDLINLGEISVQGTRHADVLKLWLSLQHLGQRSYAQLIDKSYRLTQFVVKEIQKRPFLTLASAPEMNIVCFRGTPAHLHSDSWDDWNTALQNELLQVHNIFLSLPLYRGDRWLRMVLLNPYTDLSHLAELFQAIDVFFDAYEIR